MLNNALSHAQIQRVAPSVFATEPHGRVTDRYGFVPTIDLVEAIEQEGWFPVTVRQSRVRDETRHGFQRHMLRFRQEQPTQVGDSVTELVLLNSHDGSSSFQLDLGLFRLVCSNGMVTPIGKAGGMRFRHGREVVNSVIEGVYDLVDETPQLAERVDRFSGLTLDAGEQDLYARTALALRYGDDWQQRSPVQPQALLGARRTADAGDSLWLTMNRVQENLVRGGLRGRSTGGRRVRTRAIHSAHEDVRLNRALWRLTEEFAALKAG
ncbi:MAG: DUF945 domain-containing protein [Chromatiaceae bacterium]|nr:DUF945 domain-containing protein [Chromatiaceae bacterium]MCW5586693.1 DUF945 domain-containing protein [Chromatiales bacterium]HPQ26588.1 DUF932 domain-containing protein [Gammaproteobacteria bacterium]MCP5319153.1 DUF945 domain-containing protein [Chromatiaceae bacterium]MCP5436446.1 DUF945 domain-containing protein [Chromatiaceae bacterium]